MTLQRIVVISFLFVIVMFSICSGETSTKQEEEIQKFRDKIGKQYWVLANSLILFNNSPDVLSGGFFTYDTESFVIQDLIVDKHREKYFLYYKVIFESGFHTGKIE